MADIAQPVASQVATLSFSYLHAPDVRSISVKRVVNPVLFDNLNHPNDGGLYDPAFGPLGRGDVCTTCKLTSFDCPGHFGHIDLPSPVFHPLYMVQAFQLLRGCCTYCHRFLVNDVQLYKQIARLTLLEHGLATAALELDAVFQGPAPVSKAKAAAAAKQRAATAGNDNIEDADAGESTDESLDEFRARLDQFVAQQVRAASKGKQVGAGQGQGHKGRDEYKESGSVFDVRRRVISQFLKSLGTKRRCEHCGAHAHRYRKEGHTKILEYSLVAKQKAAHSVLGIKRPNVLTDERLAAAGAKKASNGKKANGMDVDGASDDDSDAEEDNAMEVDGAAEEEEDADEADFTRGRQTERIVTPDEVRAHLRRLFVNEQHLVTLIYAPHGPLARASAARIPGTTSASGKPHASADIFFMDVVSVPPSRFRPAATMGDQVFENPQNQLLNQILRQTIVVQDLNERLLRFQQNPEAEEFLRDGKPRYAPATYTTQLYEALIDLQVTVNSMMDSGKNPAPVKQGKLPTPGVKQLLEKKEGLFRKNMMGKRVNYAARSVISPDVNIETNEIGVPPVFARKLTFPEPVTRHNLHELRKMVINGPHQHPGASFIQMEDGTLLSLDRMSLEQRQAEAAKLFAPETIAPRLAASSRPDVGLPPTRTQQINRKVYRHLQDGDIVILNRQPTLHKPSMMCHRVKVLKGEKTIRMHYANCNSYNADFDGDEMNMHFPQSLTAQAEARMIANTDNQYLVPTSGNPLRGLIQDHVVAGVWLTNKDTFFTREQYYQLIYGALRPEGDYTGEGTVKTLPPTVWKPQPLWTGKQVISTLLRNIQPPDMCGIHFSSKGKVPGAQWGTLGAEEGEVIVHDGDMLTGIIDKAQIGASAYGLVHSVFELYGATVAGKLLSILSRLLTKFLQSRAFSCRMDDLILTAKGNHDRRRMLQTVNDKGLSAALDYTGLSAADRADPATADDLRARLEEILRDDYKLAGLDATVEGETNQVTTQLIKTCLPNGLVKPFPHNNMQTMTVSGAKGSNVNASQISCLLGQQSLEGRRVPTMVSGKTLPSFKAFETAPRAGGFVAGRFLTGIRPQEYYFHCMAGREGLIDTAVKTSRSGYLQRCLIKHLEGLRVHYDHTVRNADQSVLQFHYGEDSLDVTKQKHLQQFEFAVRNMQSIINRYKPREALARTTDLDDVLPEAMKKALKKPDLHPPVLSLASPSTVSGAISERYARAIEGYIKDPKQRFLRPRKKKDMADWPAHIRRDELISGEHFRSLMNMRYMRSLVEPGEAVGLLASQGVGEPSTQMTLNTFHFAGHGAANVTLGIPRLREIVMTASQDIKTPTMNLPILEAVSDSRLKTFCQSSTRLTLSQCLDNVVVEERLTPKTSDNNYTRSKLYTVRLNLFPRADYEAEYSVSSEQILAGIARTFVPLLDKAISKEIKQNDKENVREAAEMKGKAVRKGGKGKTSGADEDGAGEEDAGVVGRGDGEEIDGDADDERRGRQADDEQTYDDEDEEGDAAVDAEEELEAKFQSAGDSDADDDDSSDDEDEDPAAQARRSKAESLERMKLFERRVPGTSRFVNKLTFDKEDGEWSEFELEFSSQASKLLLVGIVEEVCRNAIVHEVAGISRCFVAKAANTNAAAERNAVTEGVNLRQLWQNGYGIVDLNRLGTNDIGAILRTYGVEAARTSIIKEMSAVFSVYGIGVDYRHLTIIADYMTCEGGYKPFNRTGLSNNSSALLKASFETTSAFLSEAALFGDFDTMVGPSARIVVGRPPEAGTGAFAIRSVVEAAA
ncbi:hypothetical protein Rhopal_000164-T1 [Rhodotorula paludigena]|uniref:DNA-directed RNA polymerase subunit n=1 Tax=Rhodotorula paludigena TaxID=86838 RepID=A0AAV5G9W7_9BASI|nr:hypothetical protein Rhopal_000164-T1 [Rhodotorula paludigena]